MATLASLLLGIPGLEENPPLYLGCGPQTEVESVVVDSRQVGPNTAFLALRGGTHDGHDFLAAAVAAGARVLLVEHGRVEAVPGPHVVLHDTADACPIIAANLHDWPAKKLRLCGITGTNGKTTTAHLLGSILGERKHARLGTTGNWLVDREDRAGFTTPFPFELQGLLATAVERGATDAVMEVSSHALAQDRIAPIEFDAVALTSFSQDHLNFHPDMDDYFAAKRRLASDYLAADGVAIAAVDGQPRALEFLAPAPRRWRAGTEADAEIRATKWHADARGIEAEVVTPAGALALRSPLLGAFNLDNLLVATGLAIALGVDVPSVARALATATGAPGRLERVIVDGVAGPTVLVDYAHTPDAVERALAALRPICRGRLVVLLGCGGDRDAAKRPLMGTVASRDADRFYATSDNPRTEDPDQIVDQMLAGMRAEHRERVIRDSDRAVAIARAIAEADDDDIVLLAGKGHEDYQILGTDRIDFDDREHAAAALRKR